MRRLRATLGTPVVVEGVGIHLGRPARVSLEPSAFGTGVVFHTGGTEVPATLAHARPVPGATTLAADGVVVHTPEHLLAALRGLGLSDVRVVLEGPELPALDGGAARWVEALLGAGRVEGPEWASVKLRGRFVGHGGELEVVDGDGVTVEVDFPGGPHGTASWDGSVEGFRRDVAWARTFVLADQVADLQAAGRGRGARPENTLVVPRVRRGVDDGMVREAVAHKLLDAIGDLALLPPIQGRVVVRRGSHQLHVGAMRSLCAEV